MRCSNRKPILCAAATAFASLLPAQGVDAQTSTTLTIAKVQDWKQTGTAAPVQVTNPFQLVASASAQGYTIQSATFTPPGATAINLTGASTTLYTFVSAPFATAAALDAAFPNSGPYNFAIKNTSNLTITGSVLPRAVSYPAAPTLTNTEWLDTTGTLQFDPAFAFTISWTAASAANITDGLLVITDPLGSQVFSASISPRAFSVSIPANTLTGGRTYSARLTFGITSTTTTGSIVSRWTFVSATNFTLNPVSGPPRIVSPTTYTIIQGQPVAYQIEASTLASYRVDPSSLPSGLGFDAATGIIFGTPTASGNFSPIYQLTNKAGTNGGVISVPSQSPPPGPVFANATSATGRVNQPFSFQVVTTGASGSATFSATNLPPGLTINSTSGLVSGTVANAGSSAVSVTVKDGSFTRTTSLQLTFVADAVIPVITSAERLTLYPGQAVSYQITAEFGTNRADEPAFKVIGTLPAGLTFDAKTGVISGVFGGSPMRNGAPPEVRHLGETPLVQLAGTNTHGTGTSPLIFLAAPTGTVNLSTRMFVGTQDEVLIGGFIITGNAPENVVLRGIGPSLPVATALPDPILDLRDKNGAQVALNDNWRATQEQAIRDTGVPPADDRESAIVATFQPSNYTAIVSGKNSMTGIGLVELFDLGTQTQDTAQRARLVQISTRGTVRTGDDVMIGGFIIQGTATKTLLRGIGPELSAQGVAGALQDTVLELHNGSGTTISANDNWVDSPDKQAVIDTTVPPKDDRESAILATLNPGSYTAVLRGKNETTGVALVEVYNLQ